MPTFILQEISDLISATVVGRSDVSITSLAPLYRAKSNELSYLSSSAYRKYLATTQAAAVILKEEDAQHCTTATALIVKNPELAFARIARLFSKKSICSAGVHLTAVTAKSAQIHPSASIGPYCVIGEGVVIGENTVLHAQVTVQEGSVIGKQCEIHSHVSIYYHVTLHDRVVIESGAVIGREGFGLANERGVFEQIPQLGSVIIHNDVWIGANTCIDRGALDDTVLEQGVKIDNLVQIGHNVRIGAHTAIAGCTAVAGSTTIGKHCMIGGCCAITGHISIGDQVIVTGASGVSKSIGQPGIYSSSLSAQPAMDWRRSVVQLRRLGRKNV